MTIHKFVHRHLLTIVCVLGSLAGLYGSVSNAALNGTVPDPNIIVFVADDMGWGDSKSYNANSKISMPNLEALAADGMRFNDAHTSGAKCAPARYSILSGNYQYRGLQKWGQWNFRGGRQFLPGQQSLGDVAKSAGYSTAFIGKMHLGGEFYEKGTNTFVDYFVPEDDIDIARGMFEGPLTYGFDYDYVILRGIQRSPYAFFENDQLVGNPADLFTWTPGTGLGSSGLGQIIASGIGLPDWDSSTVGPTIAEKAINFIDSHHQQNLANGTDTPFFMYYSPEAAHSPHTPPLTFLGEPVRGVTGISSHLDMIYENDVALGKLTDALNARGLEDNTLIIFTSDNGGITTSVDKAAGHFSVANLAGRKGEILEGGHRVPFIVKWGDGTSAGSVIAPGSVSNQLIGAQDLMATLAAILDQPLSQDQGKDSYNILPVLLGQQSETNPIRDHLMVEADTINGIGGQPRHWAYREGPWKLIFDSNDVPDRLFNLDSDIRESVNLVADTAQASRVQAMTAAYLAKRAAQRTAPTSGNAPAVSVDAKTAGIDAFDAPGVSLATGSSVTWTYDITNEGNTALADVRLYSRQGAPVATAFNLVCSFSTLAPLATESCSDTGTVQSGLVRRDAAVQANGAAVSDNDRTYYTGGSGASARLSVSPASVNESAGTVAVDVTLSTTVNQVVSVRVSAIDGSAQLGSDYNFTTTTVQIPANQTSTTVNIDIINDTSSEPQEQFTVALSNPVNATIGSGSANVTIIDDDTGGNTPILSIRDISVDENSGSALVPISLSQTSTNPVTASVVTVSGGSATPGADYYGIAPVLITIPPGSTGTTVPVTIVDDSLVESTETVRLVMRDVTNAQAGSLSAEIDINDNDGGGGTPTVSITNQTVSESTGVANVRVELNTAAPTNVTVTAITGASGSATPGSDYYGIAPQTVVIPQGQLSASFEVVILNDAVSEPSETVEIRIINPVSASAGNMSAFLTIADDDSAGNCGTPDINPSTSRDLHLWQDCGTNQWHILATGGDETNPRVVTTYSGIIQSTLSFSDVSDPNTTPGLEPPADEVDNSTSNIIKFTLRMASGFGGVDPVDFKTASGAKTCFTLNAGASPRRVLVGPSKIAVTASQFDLDTLGQCN